MSKFYLYCTNSFWVAGPRKLGIFIDLRSGLYNSYSSTELCCDFGYAE